MLALRARRVAVDDPAPTGSDEEGKSGDSSGALPPKPKKKGTGGRKKKAELDSSSVSISSPPAGASEQPTSLDDAVPSDDASDDLGNASIAVPDKVDSTIAEPVGIVHVSTIVDVSTVAAIAVGSKGKASKSEGVKKTGTRKSKKEVPPTTAAMETMGSVGNDQEKEKNSAGALGLSSLLQLGGEDFDFSADSINGLLPNLDENLAELEANLGVLSDEFRLEDGPLSAIPGLDGLSDLDIDLMDRLRFDDKDSSMMEGIESLTESQLQDALMKLDDNDDFNIDSLMRISSSSSDSTKSPELGLKGGTVGRGKNKSAGRQKDSKTKATSSVVKDEDSSSEEDSEEGGTSMGYAAEGEEEDDLMLDVLVPNENSFELLSDEDDDDDEDDVTPRAVTTSVREDKRAGGSVDSFVGLQGDKLESAQLGQESQSSSEPSSKNILRKTGKMKSTKASGVENLSGEVVVASIPPSLLLLTRDH